MNSLVTQALLCIITVLLKVRAVTYRVITVKQKCELLVRLEQVP